jgi:glycosyltransferase involved in cell wall biosynthesis
MHTVLTYILDCIQQAWIQSIYLQIATICLGTCLLIQLVYYLVIYTRIFRYKRKVRKQKVAFNQTLPPVSVIVCARNEAHNLKEFLPLLLQQDYPEYEVIVVNDRSIDDTEDVLKLLSYQYKHLKSTFIPDKAKFIDSKKMAVTLGIKSATHDIMLFTDADCYPKSNNWIQLMVRNFTEPTQLVLGYGAYQYQKGFLNFLIRFDTLTIGMQYLNMALSGRAYMGVGRNMGYRQGFFAQTAGFTKHLNLQSGDDDLFVNENSQKGNTRIEISAESVTLSKPKESFELWLQQKSRHLSTSSYYRFSNKVSIGIELLSRLFFYVSVIAVATFGYPFGLIVATLAFFTRNIAQISVINATAKQLGEKKFYFGVTLLDILLPLINVILHLKNHFSRKSTYKWK